MVNTSENTPVLPMDSSSFSSPATGNSPVDYYALSSISSWSSSSPTVAELSAKYDVATLAAALDAAIRTQVHFQGAFREAGAASDDAAASSTPRTPVSQSFVHSFIQQCSVWQGMFMESCNNDDDADPRLDVSQRQHSSTSTSPASVSDASELNETNRMTVQVEPVSLSVLPVSEAAQADASATAPAATPSSSSSSTTTYMVPMLQRASYLCMSARPYPLVVRRWKVLAYLWSEANATRAQQWTALTYRLMHNKAILVGIGFNFGIAVLLSQLIWFNVISKSWAPLVGVQYFIQLSPMAWQYNIDVVTCVFKAFEFWYVLFYVVLSLLVCLPDLFGWDERAICSIGWGLVGCSALLVDARPTEAVTRSYVIGWIGATFGYALSAYCVQTQTWPNLHIRTLNLGVTTYNTQQLFVSSSVTVCVFMIKFFIQQVMEPDSILMFHAKLYRSDWGRANKQWCKLIKNKTQPPLPPQQAASDSTPPAATTTTAPWHETN